METHRVDVVYEGQTSIPRVFHLAGDVGRPERVRLFQGPQSNGKHLHAVVHERRLRLKKTHFSVSVNQSFKTALNTLPNRSLFYRSILCNSIKNHSHKRNIFLKMNKYTCRIIVNFSFNEEFLCEYIFAIIR